MITNISGRVKLCMDAEENTNWGLANKGKIFGLEKRKQSKKINKQQCLPFYLLFLCLKYISQCCNISSSGYTCRRYVAIYCYWSCYRTHIFRKYDNSSDIFHTSLFNRCHTLCVFVVATGPFNKWTFSL
jgi:hypothetical protein